MKVDVGSNTNRDDPAVGDAFVAPYAAGAVLVVTKASGNSRWVSGVIFSEDHIATVEDVDVRDMKPYRG